MSMANEENSSSLSINNNNELIVQPQDASTSIVEIRPARSMTCYICLENIVAMNKQFGLQNNCEHVFCFDCLSTWRRAEAVIDKNTSGRCPLCRIRSTFIAPSWRCFNDTDDKQSLIDAHKLHLKTIPCRTLSRYDYCRFGRRCYYNHNMPFILLASLSEQRRNLSNLFRENTMQSINENNNNEQQEPPRRITYNSSRYRPY